MLIWLTYLYGSFIHLIQIINLKMKNPNGYHKNCNTCTQLTCIHNPKADPYMIESNRHNALVAEEKARVSAYSTGLPTVEELMPLWQTEQCTLEEELNNHHDNVIIATTDDAYKLLHNFWVDYGKDTTVLMATVLGASDGIAKPAIDATKLMYAFDDFGVIGNLFQNNGKTYISFSSRNNGNKRIYHTLVDGVRIKNDKKYLIDSPKIKQIGYSPKLGVEGYKGAGVATFIVSASIATTDLILNDDYHLVDWFGNVGTDLFKAMVQTGAGQVALLVVLSAGWAVWIGGVAVVGTYIVTEILFSKYEVSEKVTTTLKEMIQ